VREVGVVGVSGGGGMFSSDGCWGERCGVDEVTEWVSEEWVSGYE